MPTPYGSSKKPKPRKARASSPSPAQKPPTPGEKTAGYEREQRHPSGLEWDRKKANVIAAHNGICGLCDHPGVAPNGQADHVVVGYPLDNSISNLRPVHGSSGKQKNPCPVCKLNCNQVRGSLTFQEGRAKISRRIAQQGLTPPVNDEDNGRDW